ncbi:MAG TPA: GNAT family N-acetyltransferase [Allosphingosinicella sp.]|uniref:GNAT family N-acetyltransferase n=1 Tax=Allosphingosinicella sp. TaxID=2823234 RepID=UPI002F2920C2
MTSGPTLGSPRLLLRPHGIEDFGALHGLTLAPETRAFLSGEPSREESYKRLLTSVASWHLFGYGTFAVLERGSGDYIGNCGLFRLERDLDPPFEGEPEAGWIIAQQHWGRGYAGEAMRAVLAWFDANLGIRRTVCMISTGNAASVSVAARLGYEPIGLSRYKGGDELMRYAREV